MKRERNKMKRITRVRRDIKRSEIRRRSGGGGGGGGGGRGGV